MMEKNGFEGNLEEGLEILEQFLKADKDNLKAVNKQIKENDTELEKVNQLLGKAHKEADAKARKEQLLQEREGLLPQLEQAQKDAENGAKEPEEIQTPDTFHTERKRESGALYKSGKSAQRNREGFPADRETGNGRYRAAESSERNERCA